MRPDLQNLSSEQQEAAAALSQQHLEFANLVLARHAIGYSLPECWQAIAPSASLQSSRCAVNRVLQRPDVARYLELMNADVCARARDLCLEVLDREIMGLIQANDISEFITTREVIRYNAAGERVGVEYIPMLRCHIDDLPPDVRRSIQSIEMTTTGVKVKQYSRIDALRLAAQRLGALTDRRELGVRDGSLPPPVQFNLVSTAGSEDAPATYEADQTVPARLAPGASPPEAI